MNFSLHDIERVTEITSNGYSSISGSIAVDEVNKLLSRGWKLLKIYTTCYDHDIAPQQQTIHYVLGIAKDTNQANENWDKGLISDPPQDK